MTKWTPQNVMIVAGVAVVGLWYLKGRAGAVADAVNPVNSDNVFYKGTNAVGTALTGDDHFSLGGWLYDVTH